MKRLIVLLMLGLMAVFFTTACQKDTAPNGPGTTLDDETIVQNMATDDEEEYLFDEFINDRGDEYGSINFSTFGKVSVPLDTVLRFGRHVRQFPRRVVVDIRRIARDTISVGVGREFVGDFVVVGVEDTASADTVERFFKRLAHVVRRRALFVRRHDVDIETDRHRGWRLAAISFGQGNSIRPESTIDILEVTVTSSSGDSLVITDPLHQLMYLPEDILRFNRGDQVTVQVKLINNTQNPVDPNGNGSTETVLLHYGVNRQHHARKLFTFVGTDPTTGANVYEGTWTIRQHPGRLYRAVVDVIDNGTIYDTDPHTYPYNSTTWSAPYVVLQ